MTKEIRTTGQWIHFLTDLTEKFNKESGLKYKFVYEGNETFPWALYDLNSESKYPTFSVYYPERIQEQLEQFMEDCK